MGDDGGGFSDSGTAMGGSDFSSSHGMHNGGDGHFSSSHGGNGLFSSSHGGNGHFSSSHGVDGHFSSSHGRDEHVSDSHGGDRHFPGRHEGGNDDSRGFHNTNEQDNHSSYPKQAYAMSNLHSTVVGNTFNPANEIVSPPGYVPATQQTHNPNRSQLFGNLNMSNLRKQERGVLMCGGCACIIFFCVFIAFTCFIIYNIVTVSQKISDFDKEHEKRINEFNKHW